MSKTENEPQNSTKKTKKKSTKNVEKNTKWTRNCPECNLQIQYTNYSNYYRANKRNCKCRDCCIKSKIPVGPYDYSCPVCEVLTVYKDYDTYIDNIKTRKPCKNCRKKKFIRNCPSCGVILKYTNNPNLFRANKLNSVCKACLPVPLSYNKEACKIFDEINNQLGWTGRHALNGGEQKVLKYWVDYYEPNLNLIIEYDERHHRFQKEKDLHRQDEIIQYLGCKFYRIHEGQNWREVINEL